MTDRITLGSVSRAEAAQWLPFLAWHPDHPGTIYDLTYNRPELVFWIDPEGCLFLVDGVDLEAPQDGYRSLVPPGCSRDGVLRGFVATFGEQRFVVVGVEGEALVHGPAVPQLLVGLDQAPEPLDDDVLVISTQGDLYGTLADLYRRFDPDDDPEPIPFTIHGQLPPSRRAAG